MAIDVVLPILRNEVLRARLVREHVVALSVCRSLLHYVAHVEGAQVGVGLVHQNSNTSRARRCHASTRQCDVPVSGVGIGCIDAAANKR